MRLAVACQSESLLGIWRIGRNCSDRQNTKTAFTGCLREHIDPGGAAFFGTGRSDPADETMVGRTAELALDRGPGAERPVSLFGGSHFIQIAQSREHRQFGHTLDIARSFETAVGNFKEQQ